MSLHSESHQGVPGAHTISLPQGSQGGWTGSSLLSTMTAHSDWKRSQVGESHLPRGECSACGRGDSLPSWGVMAGCFSSLKPQGISCKARQACHPQVGVCFICGLCDIPPDCLGRGKGNKRQMAGWGDRALWEVAGLKLTCWCLTQEGLALRLQEMHGPS